MVTARSAAHTQVCPYVKKNFTTRFALRSKSLILLRAQCEALSEILPCSARPFPYFINGRTDCDEIWYVIIIDPIARRFAKVMLGYSCTCTCHCAPLFRISGKGPADCAEVRCVVREKLISRFKKLTVWYRCTCARAPAQVRTPFRYLGNGWTDCAETWCMVRWPLTMRFTQDGDVHTSTRVIVNTFKHICSFPLVPRPKGVLLVGIHFLCIIWALLKM